MYNAFFNFKEKPFKLVPNPEFLFLSKSHEEALAHLTYATSQGDGFVKITGEVGTGKTTLCRVFLEDLETDIEAAFIFNSNINSVQLLKAIHSELRIVCYDSDPSEMTLALNEFLLEKKSIGKSVILLIDEAQNLGRKTLEQLRLLSNLETTRSKLLQIILVGQPELDEILESYEMRQLRQRINLSCHILPMTRKETRNYIEHRINVASRKPQALFTRGAFNDVYKYSRGIPRLINIVCDRSLLAAYSIDQKRVTSATIRIVLNELDIRAYAQPKLGFSIKKASLILLTITIFSLIFFAVFKGAPLGWKLQKTKETVTKETIPKDTIDKISSIPEVLSKSVEETQPKEIMEEVIPIVTHPAQVFPIEKVRAKEIFPGINKIAKREDAFSHILSLWGHPPLSQFNPLINQIESDITFFNVSATLNNFHLLRFEIDLDQIKQFNLPVILKFISSDNDSKSYLIVAGITSEDEYIVFPGKDKNMIKVDPVELSSLVTTDIYILWKDNFGYSRLISETSSKASIISIKLFLRKIGFSSIDLSPIYDASITDAVKQIQAKYGLVQDGIVGPMTRIMMYNEKKEDLVPYLDKSQFTNDQTKGK